MRNNQFTFILVGALFLCTLVTVLQFFRYKRALGRMPETQQNAALFQFYKDQVIAGMVKDMMEYSTKNPAIDPLLKSYGIVVNRSTAAK